MNTIVKIMLLAYILSGCTTTSGSFCKIAKAQHITEQTVDAMTEKEVDAALAHNLKGQKLCGWKS